MYYNISLSFRKMGMSIIIRLSLGKMIAIGLTYSSFIVILTFVSFDFVISYSKVMIMMLEWLNTLLLRFLLQGKVLVE